MKGDERDILGFNALFKGLDKFINLMADMVENDKDEAEIKGTIGDGLNNKDIMGSYGFKIKLGTDNIRSRVEDGIKEAIGRTESNEKKKTSSPLEPVTDIFDEEDRIIIVMEMPGVALDEIHYNTRGHTVFVSAANKDSSYSKKIELKFIPVFSDISMSLNNSLATMVISKADNSEGEKDG